MADRPLAVAVAVSETELPAPGRHWGHGGWQPPADREALDWLTLARLLGWRVEAGGTADALASSAGIVVVACAPEELGLEEVALLRRRLEAEPLLVVCRAPKPEEPLAQLVGAVVEGGVFRGTRLDWTGPGEPQSWPAAKPVEGLTLGRAGAAKVAEVWSRLDGRPLAVARSVGAGVVLTLGFHPSAARDASGGMTAMLRRALVAGRPGTTAWLDFEGALVLRMDDPGGSQNAFCRDWCYPPLDAAAWAEIGAELRRRDARLSVAYSAGWADDGDPERGRLSLAGADVPRLPGAVHPSALVRYEDLRGHAPGRVYDYGDEYDGLRALRAAGLGDVELHGHTHVHPDTAAWAQAADRYVSMKWFRELGPQMQVAIDSLPEGEDPLAAGIAGLERLFGARPTTLVPPGDEFTAQTLDRALEVGLAQVDSYYLAFVHDGRFCWAQHVCSPYLDLDDAEWFAAGLPVVGYFHDREPAEEGVRWLADCLDRWQEAGARRFLDFRELASALGRRVSVEHVRGGDRLVVEAELDAPELVRDLPVLIEFASEPPSQLDAVVEGREEVVEVERVGGRRGRVLVRPDPADGEAGS